MNETEAAGAAEVVQQTGIDTAGVGFAAAVAVVAVALLAWHVRQVQLRPATTYDKVIGGVWAAIIVLAVVRVVSLLV